MNNIKLMKKVRPMAYGLLQSKKFVAPVDLLMCAEILDSKDYERWRMGHERAYATHYIAAKNTEKITGNKAKIKIEDDNG